MSHTALFPALRHTTVRKTLYKYAHISRAAAPPLAPPYLLHQPSFGI
nr:MAG TPA: hypothetical protein [Caudoviricetes sp.]